MLNTTGEQKMQKKTIRYHYRPTRMAEMKHTHKQYKIVLAKMRSNWNSHAHLSGSLYSLPSFIFLKALFITLQFTYVCKSLCICMHVSYLPQHKYHGDLCHHVLPQHQNEWHRLGIQHIHIKRNRNK